MSRGMSCRICGKEIPQVSSATLELALFQHLLWIHGVLR
jgi:hypothetical protein